MQKEKQKSLSNTTIKVVLVTYIDDTSSAFAEFLNYYQKMGITDYVVIDCSSNNKAQSIAKGHSNITIEPYQGNNTEFDFGYSADVFRNKHCKDFWCLSVRSNERFIYPLMDQFSISQFCQYLEYYDYEAVYSQTIALYPVEDAEKTIFGTLLSGNKTAWLFKKEGYRVLPTTVFPYFKILPNKCSPGPYVSLSESATLNTPRIPLIQWKQRSHHQSTGGTPDDARLADLITCLAKTSQNRPCTTQSDQISETLKDSISTANRTPERPPELMKYRHPDQLLEYGYITITKNYSNWAYRQSDRPELKHISAISIMKSRKRSLINGRREIAPYGEFSQIWDTYIKELDAQG